MFFENEGVLKGSDLFIPISNFSWYGSDLYLRK